MTGNSNKQIKLRDLIAVFYIPNWDSSSLVLNSVFSDESYALMKKEQLQKDMEDIRVYTCNLEDYIEMTEEHSFENGRVYGKFGIS